MNMEVCLLSVLRCAWALRGFAIAVSVAAMGFTLSGCSYFFVRGAEGSYLATGTPVLGKVTARNESEQTGGSIEIGSAEKQQCKGRYRVSQVKTNFWKLETGERIYRGKIYCLDGRVGAFELISKDKGKTGSITGEINGEAFQLDVYESKSRGCRMDECWGLKWTYEKQRDNIRTYYRVATEHEPGSTDLWLLY
jgi:hypothetical protein